MTLLYFEIQYNMGSDEMGSRRTGKVFRAVVFALTAFMIGFAFVHSSMSAAASSVESAEALDFITQIFRSFGFSIEMTDHIIRKLAHFSEFTVIGGLLTSCAYSFDRFKPYRYIFAVLFTGLFTAVIDEFSFFRTDAPEKLSMFCSTFREL